MSDQYELRRLLCSTSLGYTAYHVWAQQARKERRYNIARLLEASSNVKRVRAEQALRALGEVGNTASNIERALAGLEPETVATGPVTGTSQISRELMGRAAQALAENRDLRADELGDLYVCSGCGELMEGAIITVCSICGTVSEGFLKFRAADAMGTVGPTTTVAQLERTEAILRSLVKDLTNEQLLLRSALGYSLKELIGHLTDVDGIFRERAWLILETDAPELSPAHPPTLSYAATYRDTEVHTLLEAFHNSRVETLSLLRGLTRAAWHRTGRHEVLGIIPLTHQGNWIIGHEREHLIEMAQMRHDILSGDLVKFTTTIPSQSINDTLEGE